MVIRGSHNATRVFQGLKEFRDSINLIVIVLAVVNLSRVLKGIRGTDQGIEALESTLDSTKSVMNHTISGVEARSILALKMAISTRLSNKVNIQANTKTTNHILPRVLMSSHIGGLMRAIKSQT